ncbi:hypothetical protein SODALDRAFT_362032 [Sodiomyces alkalinus F11]|uniref:Uncharacterized protein n=1 Tax=Sodiomyces alkalinus (strain CBS 110278 / VKM F-3762 / F11) TaxID=1314773 RepID=A0A3N2PP89_SODAK|nr:hypothetical protein SODALDRAFT_362032 [Sodiomyces alkalinus F11]ROT36250.1 hypothetical protein SODALDRAFT_362032 [Sodiomyces alkalinus F11]
MTADGVIRGHLNKSPQTTTAGSAWISMFKPNKRFGKRRLACGWLMVGSQSRGKVLEDALCSVLHLCLNRYTYCSDLRGIYNSTKLFPTRVSKYSDPELLLSAPMEAYGLLRGLGRRKAKGPPKGSEAVRIQSVMRIFPRWPSAACYFESGQARRVPNLARVRGKEASNVQPTGGLLKSNQRTSVSMAITASTTLYRSTLGLSQFLGESLVSLEAKPLLQYDLELHNSVHPPRISSTYGYNVADDAGKMRRAI